MSDDIDTLIFNQQSAMFGVLGAATSQFGLAFQLLQGLATQPLGTNTLPKIDITPPAPGDPGLPPVYNGAPFRPPTFDAIAPQLQTPPPLIMPDDPGQVPSVLPYNPPPQPGGSPDDTLLQGVPQVTDDLDVPAAPDLLAEIQGVAKPDLLALDIPQAPTYLAPAFDGVRPIFDAVAPTDLDVTYRQQFDTISPAMRAAVESQFDAFMAKNFPNFAPGLAAIEARLQTYLAGGTALTPDIEDAIFSRTQAKIEAEGRRKREQNWGEAARAGHTIPNAILINLQSELEQAGLEEGGEAAREIAIDQAKREQDNLQFAVRQSTDLRKIAIDAGVTYYGHLATLNGQALEYARGVVDAIVRVYDLATKAAEIQARLYEADARVYEARQRGAMAVIEAYSALVRAEEAKAQVNTQLIAMYRTQIEAVQAEANVYKTLVDALGLQVQLRRLEVDVYDARVRAYGSQVNALTARQQGYEAAVRGEAAKVQASAEQVRAYSAKAAAFGEIVRARATAIDSVNRTNESTVRSYQAQAEVFRTLTLGQAEVIKAQIESFAATIQGFIAKANAISEKSKSEVAAYEAGLRAVVATAQIVMEELREADNLRIHRAEGIARISSDAAGIIGRVASSMASGINTLIANTASTST